MKRIDTDSKVTRLGSCSTAGKQQPKPACFRPLVEMAPDPILVHKKGLILYINRAGADLLQKDRGQIIGKNLLTFVHPDCREEIANRLADADRNPEIKKFVERRLRLSNGKTLQVDVFSTPAIFEGKPATHVILRNLAKHRRLEEERQYSEDKFRILFENAGDVIMLLDTSGVVGEVNTEVERLFGFKACDIIGKHFSVLPFLETDDLPRAVEILKKLMRRSRPPRLIELQAVRKDGKPIQVEVSARTIGNNGDIDGVLGILRDVSNRKQAEFALKKSEKKFQSLYDDAPDMYFTLDVKTGKIHDCNRLAARTLGYRKAEINCHSIYEFLHPNCSHKAKEIFTSLTEKSKVRDAELQLLTNDGTVIDVSLNVSCVREQAAEPLAARAILHDITDRKQTQQELKTASREWQTTFDSIADMVSVNAMDKTFIRVNKAFSNFFNIKPEQAIGKKCCEMIHSTDKCVIRCPHAEMIRTKKPATVEMFEPNLGIHLEISASPIFDNDGQVVASTHIIKDITERKQIEQKLRGSEEKHRTIIESSSDCICNIDLDGNFVYMSPAGLASHGLKSVKDIRGRHCTEMAEQQYHELLEHKLAEARAGRTVTFQYEGETTKGLRWFESTLRPVEDDLGQVTSFIRVSRDMTDRKDMETKLRESEDLHRTLIESSLDCICSLNTKGNFLYMSPAGLESHGFESIKEIRGQHCTELAEPAYHKLIREKLREAKKGGPVRFQYESRTIQGVRWFESTLTPIVSDAGKILRFLRISRDITGAKVSEQKIRQSMDTLEKTFQATIRSLSAMIEKRDPYTAGHQERVARLATAISEEMGLAEDQTTGLRIAGLVHDIGKVNIPAEILSKPGKLTETEFKIIRTHPEISYEILTPIDFPWAIAEIVVQHHERLDGSGYPNGLSGDDVRLEARILAVADVVEAMSSHRPYRPARGMTKALQEISKNKGTLYDAEVVESCLRLVKEKRFVF